MKIEQGRERINFLLLLPLPFSVLALMRKFVSRKREKFIIIIKKSSSIRARIIYWCSLRMSVFVCAFEHRDCSSEVEMNRKCFWYDPRNAIIDWLKMFRFFTIERKQKKTHFSVSQSDVLSLTSISTNTWFYVVA